MKLRQKLDRIPMGALAPLGAREPLQELLASPACEAQPRQCSASELDHRAEPACAVQPEPRSEGELDDRLRSISTLRARLQALEGQPRDARPSARAARQSAGSAAVGVTSDAGRSLPAEQHETVHGTLCRAVTVHDEDHRHGTAEVLRACHARGSEVSVLALDPALATVDFARALYIDTETTGLAGGAGTLPFLIGMAWFEGARLVVEQLFLPRPGLEGPLLARLAERMAVASVIVSYNGKSFDWPLLRTRFILNRIGAPKLPAHLDLLHCARRIYKSRLGSMRLVHLEQELLGFERVDDIAGELIPQTYFAYLRGITDGSTLTPILDHNRSDLVALPALLGEILRRFRGEHAAQDARDQLGFAKVAARAAESEQAIAFAHAAVAADLRGEFAATALFLVGELKLRAGDLVGACEAFERAIEVSVQSFDCARAHLALSKLHERKTKCLERALLHAEQTAHCEGELASARRVARLRARLEKLCSAQLVRA